MNNVSLYQAQEQAGSLVVSGAEGEPLSAVQSYLIGLGSTKSRVTARSILNNVAVMMGANDSFSLNWPALRRDHIIAIVAGLQKRNLAPATINTYLTIIKGVMRECWQKKQIDIDTLERIKSVKRVRGSRLAKGRAVSQNELTALLAACDDGSLTGIRDAALLSLMVGCGLRRSEVVSIDAASLVFDDRAIRVIGKGDKERMVYLPDAAWNRLIAWMDDVRGFWDGPLFLRIRKSGDVTPGRLTDQAVYHILNSRRIMAGISELSPHDLRRTFATRLLANGEDISTVKDAMGHASITTTQQYDKRGSDRLKAARDRLVF